MTTVHFDRDLQIPGLPGGSDGKESACKVGDPGLIPGEGNGYHSSIPAWRIPRRGAWQATVHGITKSQT